MKYLVFVLLVACIFSCQVKKKTSKKIVSTNANTSGKKGLQKVNPIFLDTIYHQREDGSMTMSIQLSKNLDTTYVENPVSGELQMIVSRKNSPTPAPRIETNAPKTGGDTVYYKNPETGDIEMIITD